jgi:hypothetical protein
MSKHTPGPWTYNLTTGVVRSLAEDFPNCRQPVICDLRHWSHEDTTHIHPANARLIAAAPELLEALKEIAADYADRFDLDDPSTNPGIKYTIKQARAAIAKATGASA